MLRGLMRPRIYCKQSCLPYGVPDRFILFGGRWYGHFSPTTTTADGDLEVKVERAKGVGFTLKMCRPPKPEVDSPIIIYLRRGIPATPSNHSYVKELAQGANATAVEIDYTLSRDNPFPSPIHKTLAGYDWVRKHIGSGKVSGYDHSATSALPSKVGVCGDLVGGSLATMLALTECHNLASNAGSQGISAVAVGNPIVDWTALFDNEGDQPPSRYPSKTLIQDGQNMPQSYNDMILTIKDLLDARKAFFKKPETYFDPFASPLLFFRTPSADLPVNSRMASPIDSSNGSVAEDGSMEPTKKRRSHRKYPPPGFDLVLPHMRVEVGMDCVLKDQGTELIELAHKSFKRTEEETRSSGKATLSRSFELIETEGLGLWHQEHMLGIGRWFGDVLRRH